MVRKCGNCGGVGHDKRKCPDNDGILKTHTTFEKIYSIECEEDNGDSVHKTLYVSRSIDGLMKRLKDIYDGWSEIYGDEEYGDPGELHNGLFERECESFKNVPFPLKDTIEEKVKDPYSAMPILIIGEVGSAAGFACKVSVRMLKLYD